MARTAPPPQPKEPKKLQSLSLGLSPDSVGQEGADGGEHAVVECWRTDEDGFGVEDFGHGFGVVGGAQFEHFDFDALRYAAPSAMARAILSVLPHMVS